MNSEREIVNALLALARTGRRSAPCATTPPGAMFFAHIPHIAHIAWADGRNPDDAMARLRVVITDNLARIRKAIHVLAAPVPFTHRDPISLTTR